jgi:hypothetical protein
MQCKKCKPGEFEEATCVSTRDTKCDSCTNPKARINDDFLKNCDWGQLGKNIHQREFDVEVIDMQSKEMSQLDGSPEFGSDEEDLDRMLTLSRQPEQEEDITVDDPEIDLENPPKMKRISEDDMSTEEELEWALATIKQDEADREIAQISKRLETEKNNDDVDDDDDDDFEEGPRRLLMHPLRPLPQMVPALKLSNLDDQDDDTVLPKNTPTENNFPPSYHGYPIDSLLHAGEGQRRKAIVLLVLTCSIVLSTIIFVVCYVRDYCRRRNSSMYNRVLVVNLSPEEREIVRQSASVLERMEQPPKKYRSGSAYTTVEDEEPELGVYVTENPLEAYLNAKDERHLATESLIENEVLDEPRVHRRNENA